MIDIKKEKKKTKFSNIKKLPISIFLRKNIKKIIKEQLIILFISIDKEQPLDFNKDKFKEVNGIKKPPRIIISRISPAIEKLIPKRIVIISVENLYTKYINGNEINIIPDEIFRCSKINSFFSSKFFFDKTGKETL